MWFGFGWFGNGNNVNVGFYANCEGLKAEGIKIQNFFPCLQESRQRGLTHQAVQDVKFRVQHSGHSTALAERGFSVGFRMLGCQAS